MKNILAGILTAFIFFIINQSALSQTNTFKPVFKQWTIDDGLPQNSITGILQSDDGYIWLTSYGGIVRFDGVNFTIFNRFNSPGLLTDRIVCITQDLSKKIWVGTEEDLACMKDGKLQTFDTFNNLPKGEISNILEDYKGRLWLKIINNPLYYFQNGKIKKFPSIRIAEGTAVGLSLNKRILIVNNQKLFRLDGDSLTVVASTKGIIIKNIIAVIEDREGSYWIATHGEGIFRFSKNKFTRYLISNDILDNTVNDIYCDKDSRIWITTNNGLAYFNGGGFVTITNKNGLPTQGVLRIIQDKEGAYWIGTITGGLIRMRNSLFQTYSSADGLLVDNLLSICQRKDGSVLFGSNCGGLHELKNGIVSNSPLTKFLMNNCVWSVLEHSDGTIWVGSEGLTLISGDKSRVINTENGLIDNMILAMYEDKTGNMWVGSGGGLQCFSGNSIKTYTAVDGLSDNQVRCMLQDSHGILWIGTLHGLNKLEKGKITSVKIPGLTVDYFRSILEDNKGALWFGTYEGGLVRYKNGKFNVLTTEHGLHDNMISHLLEDNYGYFWIGCNRGIFRVNENDLNSVADGKKNKFNSYVYSKTDGMLDIETNGGFQPSAIKLKDGRLCFPTVKGLAIINPADIKVNEIIPPVIIESIIIDGKVNKIKPYIELDYTRSNFEIKYTALSFADPQKVRFKYYLEGIDKGWIDAGANRSVQYTNVSSGYHRFKVIACNNDGMWNYSGASFIVYVSPPFWNTWWFITLSILFFLLIVYLYYLRRISLIKKAQKLQKEFSRNLIDRGEEDRKRIASELHDSLGQELLIIKNRAMLALEIDSDIGVVRDHLEEISSLSSQAIGEVRQITYNLRPFQLDRVGLTKALESLVARVDSSTGIEFKMYIDNIDNLFLKDYEINIYRIVQEGINNIIKHSNASTATLMVSKEEGEVCITVEDNGKGFPSIPDDKSAIEYSGFGLTGIKERAHFLGGNVEINSTPGKGSVIRITLPITGQKK